MAFKTEVYKIKGMRQDSSESAYNNEFGYENRNIRFISTGNGTTMSIEQDHGNLVIDNSNVRVYSLTDCIEEARINAIRGRYVSDEKTYVIEYPNSHYTNNTFLLDYHVIGYYVFNDFIVTFGIYPETERCQISRIELKNGIWHVINFFENQFSQYLGFKQEYPIETVGVEESALMKKVYFVDGINLYRGINIVDPLVFNNPSSIYLGQDLQLNEQITVSRVWVSGGFPSGKIQFAFKYKTKFGTETNFVDYSPMFDCTHKTEAFDSSVDPNNLSSESFNVIISNLDTSYNVLILYYFLYTSQNSCQVYKKEFNYVPEEGSAFNQIITHLSGFEETTIEKDQNLYPSIIPYTLAMKDNYMILGNIKTALPDIPKNLYKNDFKVTFFQSKIGEEQINNHYVYQYNPSLTTFQENSSNFEYMGFMRDNWYKFGIIAQFKTGEWSSVIPIEIKRCDKSSCSKVIYNNSGKPEKIEYYIPHAVLLINNNNVNLLKDFFHTLKGSGFKKIAPVCVVPTIDRRDVITQGIVAPTLYTGEARLNPGSAPFCYPSWFYRPKQIFDNFEEDCTMLVNNINAEEDGLSNVDYNNLSDRYLWDNYMFTNLPAFLLDANKHRFKKIFKSFIHFTPVTKNEFGLFTNISPKYSYTLRNVNDLRYVNNILDKDVSDKTIDDYISSDPRGYAERYLYNNPACISERFRTFNNPYREFRHGFSLPPKDRINAETYSSIISLNDFCYKYRQVNEKTLTITNKILDFSIVKDPFYGLNPSGGLGGIDTFGIKLTDRNSERNTLVLNIDVPKSNLSGEPLYTKSIFVDESICTLNSPNIDFGQYFPKYDITYLTKMGYITYVGYAQITGSLIYRRAGNTTGSEFNAFKAFTESNGYDIDAVSRLMESKNDIDKQNINSYDFSHDLNNEWREKITDMTSIKRGCENNPLSYHAGPFYLSKIPVASYLGISYDDSLEPRTEGGHLFGLVGSHLPNNIRNLFDIGLQQNARYFTKTLKDNSEKINLTPSWCGELGFHKKRRKEGNLIPFGSFIPRWWEDTTVATQKGALGCLDFPSKNLYKYTGQLQMGCSATTTMFSLAKTMAVGLSACTDEDNKRFIIRRSGNDHRLEFDISRNNWINNIIWNNVHIDRDTPEAPLYFNSYWAYNGYGRAFEQLTEHYMYKYGTHWYYFIPDQFERIISFRDCPERYFRYFPMTFPRNPWSMGFSNNSTYKVGPIWENYYIDPCEYGCHLYGQLSTNFPTTAFEPYYLVGLYPLMNNMWKSTYGCNIPEALNESESGRLRPGTNSCYSILYSNVTNYKEGCFDLENPDLQEKENPYKIRMWNSDTIYSITDDIDYWLYENNDKYNITYEYSDFTKEETTGTFVIQGVKCCSLIAATKWYRGFVSDKANYFKKDLTGDGYPMSVFKKASMLHTPLTDTTFIGNVAFSGMLPQLYYKSGPLRYGMFDQILILRQNEIDIKEWGNLAAGNSHRSLVDFIHGEFTESPLKDYSFGNTQIIFNNPVTPHIIFTYTKKKDNCIIKKLIADFYYSKLSYNDNNMYMNPSFYYKGTIHGNKGISCNPRTGYDNTRFYTRLYNIINIYDLIYPHSTVWCEFPSVGLFSSNIPYWIYYFNNRQNIRLIENVLWDRDVIDVKQLVDNESNMLMTNCETYSNGSLKRSIENYNLLPIANVYNFGLISNYTKDTVEKRNPYEYDNSNVSNYTWKVCGYSYQIDDILDKLEQFPLKKDIIEFCEGDIYFQKYNSIKTLSLRATANKWDFDDDASTLGDGSSTDENIHNDIAESASIMIESYINLDGSRPPLHRLRTETRSPLSAPTKEIMSKWINDAYSLQDQRGVFYESDLTKDEIFIGNYPTMIMWSMPKIYGELNDSYGNVPITNSYFADDQCGAITKLSQVQTNVYCLQQHGLSVLDFNPSQLAQTESGSAITISYIGELSSLLRSLVYVSKDIGTNNKWSVISTLYGLYFIDDKLGKIYKISSESGLQDITVDYGMSDYVSRFTDSNIIWYPYSQADNYSWLASFDKNTNELYFTNEKDSSSLGFNTTLNSFTSFYDYVLKQDNAIQTSFMFNYKDMFLQFCTSGDSTTMYIQNCIPTSIYNVFNKPTHRLYGNKFISQVGLLVNSDFMYDKVFNFIEYYNDVYSSISNETSNNKMNLLVGNTSSYHRIRVWNEYQDTGEIELNRLNTKQKFRLWRTEIPRNADSRDRIRGPWCRINLYGSLTDKDGYYDQLHSIAVNYTLVTQPLKQTQTKE